MTSPEAAQLLELPVTATSDQVEVRFLELRRRLEDKIAKAPTPGLQTKYRESLDEITLAFETLILAADVSTLPVLKKEPGHGRPEAGGAAPLRAAGDGCAATPPRNPRAETPGLRPSSVRNSGGREFLIVALLAVAVLGAGGWFVMKTRAESAGRARLAAEAKAEADRQAEQARLGAEAERQRLATERRQAEEEKERIAATARAEQDRVDRLLALLRVKLAESKLRWEALAREESEAERTLGELRSELRSAREANAGRRAELSARAVAQQAYGDWLRDHLFNHPARRLRARAEELVSSRQVDDAAREITALENELAELPALIAARKQGVESALYGPVAVAFEGPVGSWWIEDAFGRRFEGGREETLAAVARGPATFAYARPGFPERRESVMIAKPDPTRLVASLPGGAIRIRSRAPESADVWLAGRLIGRTPLDLGDVPPGEYEFELRADGHTPLKLNRLLHAGHTVDIAAELESSLLTEAEIIRRFTSEAAGIWVRTGQNYPGTTVMRIVPGSNRAARRAWVPLGKVMDDDVFLRVSDRAARTVIIESADPARAAQVRAGVWGDTTIFYENGRVITSSSFRPRMVYERGSESDWR